MKQEQKKLITEIMNDDAKDRLYISSTKSNADMNIGFTDQWKDTTPNIGGQTKQTAVEWLVEMLYSPVCNGFINGNRRVIPHDIIEQAKQMEKEQIIDAWENGKGSFSTRFPEQYYNETYGGQGSPDTSPNKQNK